MNFLSAGAFAVACGVWMLPLFVAMTIERREHPFTEAQKIATGLAYRDAFLAMTGAAAVYVFLNHYEILPKFTISLAVFTPVLFGLTVFFSSGILRGRADTPTGAVPSPQGKRVLLLNAVIYGLATMLYGTMIIERFRDGTYQSVETFGVFDAWSFLYLIAFSIVGSSFLRRYFYLRKKEKEEAVTKGETA